MIEFRMPSLGADMEHGTVLEWYVKPGDHVRRGDIVAVIDTEKAEIEVEIWDEGTVERILIPPGDQVRFRSAPSSRHCACRGRSLHPEPSS
jgi:pyruvate dehydrogenase E2 component (dihydrolipoamide acetyltransferase)